jgi:integration host factor subunit alpha
MVASTLYLYLVTHRNTSGIIILKRGKNIEIGGFGKFGGRYEVMRIGRNPITGEEADITARKVVTFKPSRFLREAVDGKS